MKILVTGGCGFIGSNFILCMLKKYPDYSIINIDNLTYAGNKENLISIEDNPNYRFVKGDICDKELVNSLIKGVDAIVHFAEESHVDRSILYADRFVKTNVLGTQVLLDAALRNGKKRFHHISCYDEKTKAFTMDGLKSFKEIKKGDLVLSLNQQTKEIEWKPVEKVIIQNYKGKMLRMKTQRSDFLVTPNHRMLIQNKKSKKLVFKEAKELKKEAINKLPNHYSWKGKFPDNIKNMGLKDFFYLLGIFIGDGFLAYQEKKQTNKTGLDKKDYMQKSRNKLGQFSSIGKIGNIKYSISKSWRIFIDIPEKDSCRKRCEKTLDNLKIKWHAHKGKAGEHLYFTSKKFFEIFKQCRKYAKNKEIPKWALEAPTDLLYLMWEGLLDSDGHKRHIYHTASKKLAYQFMELCVKLGLSPNLSKRKTESNYQRRTIKGSAYAITCPGQFWRDIRRNNVKEEDYKGKIWCLKVKDNKNFLIERNGKTAFCGNTDEVFGALGKEGKFSETTSYDPRSPYSASKAAADYLVRAYHHTYGLPVTISNCSNNYGPYQFPEKLIPLFVTNLIEGKKVPVYGKGLNIRDWIHVDDHNEAVDLILHKGRIGETYCIGGNAEIRNIDITQMILKAFNHGDEMVEFVQDRKGHDFRYAIDFTKIKNELGWQPKHTFEQGLKETIEWYKKNEKWWKTLKKRIIEDITKKQ